MKNITSLDMIPFSTLVTVRVKGESKRLSRVRLEALDTKADTVKVLTGMRGRPRHLEISRISEVKVLATAS